MSAPYIYESPDGGKTVTRRKFGEQEKETIQTAEEVVADLFDGEPAVSTLTEEEIDTKFDTVRKSLKAVRLRANWTQDYTMSHNVKEAVELIDQLELDIKNASETAKIAIKHLNEDLLEKL